jgi:hypothetical protein
MSTVEKHGNVKGHVSADVGVIRISMPAQPPFPAGMKSVVPGVTITGVSGTVMMMVPLDTNIKLFAQALVANEVFLFGYPRAIGLPNIPQIDYSRAILRKGIIAQKNLARKTLIIDAPVYGGNSGGPVIELEREDGAIKYRIVGVAIELVPGTLRIPRPGLGSVSPVYTHSGYSVVEPMDAVLELVNSF